MCGKDENSAFEEILWNIPYHSKNIDNFLEHPKISIKIHVAGACTPFFKYRNYQKLQWATFLKKIVLKTVDKGPLGERQIDKVISSYK